MTDNTQPAALAADHPEQPLDMVGRWYMVNKDGMATLCADREDAEKEAADAQSVWPHMGPHRAVQLVEASTAGFTAADMATASAQGFRDGVASLSANAGEPSGHIKEPYTLAEIKAKIASNDYSAEMLLQHAMLLLDSASLAASVGSEPVAGIYQLSQPASAHDTITEVIKALRTYNPQADEQGGKFIHKGWANQLEAVAPPQISESDADYWVRNRALILRAIEERGFRLVSSGGLFWLSGPAQPSPPGGMVGGWSKGVEAAAALLSKKADDFARENGYDDMGSLSFGSGSHADAKLDYHSSLIELAEEVRAMLNAPPTTPAGSGKGE